MTLRVASLPVAPSSWTQMGNDISLDLNTEMSQPIIAKKEKASIRGVKFWSLPSIVEVYTMKKFNRKDPTIMRKERIAENGKMLTIK